MGETMWKEIATGNVIYLDSIQDGKIKSARNNDHAPTFSVV
jgi:hypothetical protein